MTPAYALQYRDVSFPPLTPPPAPPPPITSPGFYPNTTSTVMVPGLRFGALQMPFAYMEPNVPKPPPVTQTDLTGTLPITYPQGVAYAGIPANIAGGTATPYGSGLSQSDDVPDIVIGDVLSMDVRVMLGSDPECEFVDLGHAKVQAYNMGNPAYDPNNAQHYNLYNKVLPKKPLYMFDTWVGHGLINPESKTYGQLDYSMKADDPAIAPIPKVERWRRRGTLSCIPLYEKPVLDAAGKPVLDVNGQPVMTGPITIRALQVTLRLWDSKSGFTRQVTMIQEF